MKNGYFSKCREWRNGPSAGLLSLIHTSMRLLLPIALLLAVLIGGCSNLLYKPEVQQGVLLSTEMLEKLKPDLTKRQVRLLLGTPSVSDAFHPERWDYVYYVGKAGAKVHPQRLTLYFRNDSLARAEGDLAPAALVKPAVNDTVNKALPDSNSASTPP
jgi:outer membrane protein assembly factor BamE